MALPKDSLSLKVLEEFVAGGSAVGAKSLQKRTAVKPSSRGAASSAEGSICRLYEAWQFEVRDYKDVAPTALKYASTVCPEGCATSSCSDSVKPAAVPDCRRVR